MIRGWIKKLYDFSLNEGKLNLDDKRYINIKGISWTVLKDVDQKYYLDAQIHSFGHWKRIQCISISENEFDLLTKVIFDKSGVKDIEEYILNW